MSVQPIARRRGTFDWIVAGWIEDGHAQPINNQKLVPIRLMGLRPESAPSLPVPESLSYQAVRQLVQTIGVSHRRRTILEYSDCRPCFVHWWRGKADREKDQYYCLMDDLHAASLWATRVPEARFFSGSLAMFLRSDRPRFDLVVASGDSINGTPEATRQFNLLAQLVRGRGYLVWFERLGDAPITNSFIQTSLATHRGLEIVRRLRLVDGVCWTIARRSLCRGSRRRLAG